MIESVGKNAEGKPTFLAEWEEKANAGEEPKLETPWDHSFVKEWLTIPPRLADRDLRGALYVSREHAPLITPEDRLSSEGIELLAALLEHPKMAADLRDRLATLQHPEITVILDRLLERARQVQEWGVPDILEACLAVTRTDPSQGIRLAGFLRDRPSGQITPAIVPKIDGEPWSESVFEKWNKSDVAQPVKKAIERGGNHGNV